MECLIGIQFKDFVLVAADMTTAQSIMVMKNGKKLNGWLQPKKYFQINYLFYYQFSVTSIIEVSNLSVFVI